MYVNILLFENLAQYSDIDHNPLSLSLQFKVQRDFVCALATVLSICLYYTFFVSDHDRVVNQMGIVCNFFTILFFASPLINMVRSLSLSCGAFYFAFLSRIVTFTPHRPYINLRNILCLCVFLSGGSGSLKVDRNHVISSDCDVSLHDSLLGSIWTSGG